MNLKVIGFVFLAYFVFRLIRRKTEYRSVDEKSREAERLFWEERRKRAQK
jgi:hypothetical protein